jgi:uncharacterized protein DUF6924
MGGGHVQESRVMRTLPKADGYYPDLLVIRTDYHDEQAWQAVKAALAEPWGVKGEESVQDVSYVDDPAWADASVDTVLAALEENEEHGEYGEYGWSVVFIADHVTMAGNPGKLLAVNTEIEDDENVEDYQREFRTEPRQRPHDIHCNLSLGNMDFEDFAPGDFD